MSFITDADLRTRVAQALHLAQPAMLPASWDDIIPDANERAYRDIVGALQERGFTQLQIDGWAGGVSVQKLQGLYWALVMGAGLHSFDDRWVNKLDQRTSLTSILVDDGSGGIQPPGGTAGVQVGNLDDTNDRWQMDKNTGFGWNNRDRW